MRVHERRPRSVRRWALAVVVMTAAACGGDDDEETATTRKPTTTTTPVAGGSPLTGLEPSDPAFLGRPALVVKIDNAPKARPQAGINEADVVFEEGVEGGVTRFAAIFHSADASSVGPVRSARSTDIALSRQLGRPLFAYSGANAVFAKLLKDSPLVDVGVGVVPSAYRREKGRPSPYNLFSSTPPLFAKASGDLPPPGPLFQYRAMGEAPAEQGSEPAVKVTAVWKDRITTAAVFEWDAAGAAFPRTLNGTPHVDAAGTRVAPANVVFQVVKYVDTGLVDRSGAAVPEAELIGEGEAVVLTGGRLIRGRWSKAGVDDLTSYTDAAGAPIRLTRGRTWVELVPEGNLKVG
jgi:hypothetical protein